MWLNDRSDTQDRPVKAFDADADAMNGFVSKFADIHRERDWASGMVAFSMLSNIAGFRSMPAKSAALEALCLEYSLPALPQAVKKSLSVAKDRPDTGHSSRDFVRGTKGVFFSLANPTKPAEVYVAALVKHNTGFGAAPVFFVASPAEVAAPDVLLGKAHAIRLTTNDGHNKPNFG